MGDPGPKWDRRRVRPQPKFGKPRWLIQRLKQRGWWTMVQAKPHFSAEDWKRTLALYPPEPE